jgi:hypothetical protein
MSLVSTTPGTYDDWPPAARVAARPHRRAQRARGGVAADGRLRCFSRGGEVLAANPAGAGGVRRAYYECDSDERGVEAGSG